MSETRKTIIISGYFSGWDGPRKLRYFERLDLALRENGYRLLLVNLTDSVIETACRHRSCPARATARPKAYRRVALADESLPEPIAHAAAVEAGANEADGADAGGARVKLLLFGGHVETILREERPALWIMWHKFNGYHHTAAYLLEQYQTPYLYAEYGQFEGTLNLDADGQMAESWVARRSGDFRALPVDAADRARAGRFLEHLRREKKSRKPRVRPGGVRAYVERARAKNRKVVLYAGQNDWGSGMLPRVLPESALHSPIYEDTLDALAHLAGLAEAHGWQILFKPHPHLEARHGNIAIPHAAHVDVLIGADIFECMELSDATVTILSQVSYLALTHERPCVMLGRHQLTGKGCVHEAASREEVHTAVASALAQGFTQAQREAWREHVAQIIKYYTYAFAGDAEEIIGRGPGCAAEELLAQAGQEHAAPVCPERPLLPPAALPPLLEARFRLEALLSQPRRLLRKVFPKHRNAGP